MIYDIIGRHTGVRGDLNLIQDGREKIETRPNVILLLWVFMLVSIFLQLFILTPVYGLENDISETSDSTVITEPSETSSEVETDRTSDNAGRPAKAAGVPDNDGDVLVNEAQTVFASGQSGKITWELVSGDEEGTYTLSINGKGAVPDKFLYGSNSPEALKEYLSGITQLKIGKEVTSIGTSAFESALPKLNKVTFEEGSALTSIGNRAFYKCTELEDIVLPQTLKSIGFYSFGYTDSLKKIEFPESLESLSDYAFYDGGLEGEVVIPGNVKTFGGTYQGPFPYCNGITKITFRENHVMKQIQSWAFAYNKGLRELDLSGLKEAESIGAVIVQTGSTDTGKIDITVGAKDIKNVSTSVFANGGYNDGEEINLYIKDSVESITQTLIQAGGKRLVPYFAPDHDITITDGALRDTTDQRMPFVSFAGKYHADAKGVLYRLEEDGTATLFYCPPGFDSYTVPESITDDSGNVRQVTGVSGSAFAITSDLKELNFEKPNQVSIGINAFLKSSVVKVNGKESIDPDKFAYVSKLCRFPTGEEETPQKAIQVNYVTEDNKSFILSITNPAENRYKDGVYEYLTGESASIWFGVNNENNADMENLTIRIYLAFDDDGENLGTYTSGSYTIVNTSAAPGNSGETVTREYPLEVKKTDVAGIYYYDIKGIQPGDVMAFSNGFMYNNISSDGGNLRVWGEVLTNNQAKSYDGKVRESSEFIKMNWGTKPNDFTLKKSITSSNYLKMQADGSENGKVYLAGLAYYANFYCNDDSSTTDGKDYVKTVDFTDTLQLPEMLGWDPDVIQAIKDGKYEFKRSDKTVYVEVNGEVRKLAYMDD